MVMLVMEITLMVMKGDGRGEEEGEEGRQGRSTTILVMVKVS